MSPPVNHEYCSHPGGSVRGRDASCWQMPAWLAYLTVDARSPRKLDFGCPTQSGKGDGVMAIRVHAQTLEHLHGPLERTSHQLFCNLIPPASRHGESNPRYKHQKTRSRKSTDRAGTLVKCDPSIKALILNLDKESNNQYVIEDLGDEEHLLVKNDRIEELKRRVRDACDLAHVLGPLLIHHRRYQSASKPSWTKKSSGSPCAS